MTNKTIVNGEEVEYFHIEQKMDGTTIVTISEEFDVVTAHMSDIMKRIRDAGYECVVSKNLHQGFIMFILHDIDDAYGVLSSLNIPFDIYHEMEGGDGNWIYVFVEDLPKYATLRKLGLNLKGVKV